MMIIITIGCQLNNDVFEKNQILKKSIHFNQHEIKSKHSL